MAKWDYLVRGFYTRNPGGSKRPYEMAVEVGVIGHIKNVEVEVPKSRPDIGRVEVVPQRRGLTTQTLARCETCGSWDCVGG